MTQTISKYKIEYQTVVAQASRKFPLVMREFRNEICFTLATMDKQSPQRNELVEDIENTFLSCQLKIHDSDTNATEKLQVALQDWNDLITAEHKTKEELTTYFSEQRKIPSAPQQLSPKRFIQWLKKNGFNEKAKRWDYLNNQWREKKAERANYFKTEGALERYLDILQTDQDFLPGPHSLLQFAKRKELNIAIYAREKNSQLLTAIGENVAAHPQEPLLFLHQGIAEYHRLLKYETVTGKVFRSAAYFPLFFTLIATALTGGFSALLLANEEQWDGFSKYATMLMAALSKGFMGFCIDRRYTEDFFEELGNQLQDFVLNIPDYWRDPSSMFSDRSWGEFLLDLIPTSIIWTTTLYCTITSGVLTYLASYETLLAIGLMSPWIAFGLAIFIAFMEGLCNIGTIYLNVNSSIRSFGPAFMYFWNTSLCDQMLHLKEHWQELTLGKFFASALGILLAVLTSFFNASNTSYSIKQVAKDFFGVTGLVIMNMILKFIANLCMEGKAVYQAIKDIADKLAELPAIFANFSCRKLHALNVLLQSLAYTISFSLAGYASLEDGVLGRATTSDIFSGFELTKDMAAGLGWLAGALEVIGTAAFDGRALFFDLAAFLYETSKWGLTMLQVYWLLDKLGCCGQIEDAEEMTLVQEAFTAIEKEPEMTSSTEQHDPELDEGVLTFIGKRMNTGYQWLRNYSMFSTSSAVQKVTVATELPERTVPVTMQCNNKRH